MARQPDPNADPYRTLGLEPGASIAEVKRAYRLLAKAFHPDSAGDAATPRFLAIQDAYEQLKAGRPSSRPRAQRAPNPPPAEPWRADPERARAARERARSARSGPGRGAGATGATGATGSAGAAGAAGAAAGRGSRTGTSSTGTSSTGARGSGRRRDVRKATMGSTSYDEARDPSDATWSGASWYGPSSGEYWIVNPREYADPRKHGPEYQQRARRPLDGGAVEAAGAAGPTGAADPTATMGAASASTAEADAPSARGTAWRTTAGREQVSEARARPFAAWAASGAAPATGDTPAGRVTSDEPTRAEAFGVTSWAWLGGPSDDPVRRFGLALVAWPPIGLAAAATIGQVTGCSVYSAECGGSEPLLPWLAQAVILGLLLLLPPVTRVLAGGAVAVLLALVPITAFLLVVGGGPAPQAGSALAVLLGVAWLIGVGWSVLVVRRRLEGSVAP